MSNVLIPNRYCLNRYPLIGYSLFLLILVAAMEWKSNINTWRTRVSYISTVISISLVLFVIGLLGIILLNAQIISDKVKENFEYSVYIKEGIKEVDVLRFKKMMDAQDFVIRTTLIDKDAAAAILSEKIGEDEQFLDLLNGENPLPVSIDIKIKAQYTHPDSLKKIETLILKNTLVSDVDYEKDNLMLIHKNTDRISAWLLGISIALLVIAIALINNTLRLKVYSQRFLIRTMQLIGAKWSFIRRPFVMSAVVQGILGSLIAVMLLMSFLSFLLNHVPELADIQNVQLNFMLYGLLIVVGVFITWLSTVIAVTKFLRLKTDELYY